jgi:anion-transporting  ArsA/GET3 family ATPase
MNALHRDQELVLPPKNSVFVLGGLGGVGKTTSSAAFSLSLARHGAKVIVITVDPAKRLLDTFGLDGNAIDSQTPIKISLNNELMQTQHSGKGELWISMLDTKASFDDLITRLCDQESEKDAILANAVYRSISTGFAYGSEYIAMERVLCLYEQGEWDYIIVDTPPGENLFTLLAAPKRMAQFFSSKTLRFLIAPYRSKFLNIASKPLYDIINRLLGLEMLFQISEFFKLFESLRRKFAKRADEVEEFLLNPNTSHILITTLDHLRSEEIINFINKFLASRHHLSAVICNSTLPEYLSEKAGIDFAERLSKGKSGWVEDYLSEQLRSFDSFWKAQSNDATEERDFVLQGFIKLLGENFLSYALVAAGEKTVYKKISSDINQKQPSHQKAPVSLIKLPYLLDPAGDMAAIAFLGEAILFSLFENPS